MEERRRSRRTQTSIRVEISHPSFGLIIGSTSDLSEGGAQVTLENSRVLPPSGTVVDVQFKKLIGNINEKPVPMRVMHTVKSTIGLMFVTT